MSIDTTDVPQITTPVAEPPVMVNFVFLGKTLRAKPITEGQLAAIQLVKGDMTAVFDTTVKVIKSRVGAANWEWMYDQLTEGNAEFSEISDVLRQLAEARKALTGAADTADEA